MSFFSEGERAFLETIRHATPDEDAPHLVFADWLEEHGECARAELIRVHVACSRLPHGHAEKESLGRRWRDLLQRHGSRWIMSLPMFACLRWEFDRGVPGRAVVHDIPQFISDADQLLEETIVYQLVIDEAIFVPERQLHIPELASVPDLHSIQYLYVRNYHGILTEETAFALAHSPGLQSLRRIRIRYVDAESPAVPVLRQAFGERLQIDSALSETSARPPGPT